MGNKSMETIVNSNDRFFEEKSDALLVRAG
jgi:hypothetical protein